MSILNPGRPLPSSTAAPVASDIDTSDGRPWWSRDPAQPRAALAPAEPVQPNSWWTGGRYRTPETPGATQTRGDDYARGVRDEQKLAQRRRKRRSHPVLALVTLSAAAFGVTVVVLAFDAGSFAGGGALVDQKIGEWRADVIAATGSRPAQQTSVSTSQTTHTGG